MPNSKRILLVEDHQDTRDALFAFLGGAGFSVLTADDGRQAIDLLQHGIRPRLVILDLILPKVSGWDVLEFMRADPSMRQIPVIVTAANPSHDASLRRRVAADVVLQKPIAFEELLLAITRLIGAVYPVAGAGS
jgi:CheY-like chemotaxis protein